MIKKDIKDLKGFTLIELLLYLSIAIAMLVVLGGIGINVLSSRVKAHSFEQVHYNGVFLSEVLQQKIRSASSLEVVSSSTLNLILEDGDINPTVVSLSDGAIYLQEGMSDAKPISGNDVMISELNFHDVGELNGSHFVSIEIRIESVNLNNRNMYSADSTFFITAHTQ